MSPLYNALASEVAGKVVMMAFVVPVSIVLAIVLRPELNATPAQVRALRRGIDRRVVIALLLGLMAGMPGFLGYARRCAVGAAGCVDLSARGRRGARGAAAAGALQTIARVLPFYYMVGFPVEVLTGHLEHDES